VDIYESEGLPVKYLSAETVGQKETISMECQRLKRVAITRHTERSMSKQPCQEGKERKPD
jgi:hypothetical protein